MAKLRNEPVDQATLLQYLETKSDFHFELKVLKMMRDLGLPCEHGGHYTDPVTKKSREFDIRCRVVVGPLRVQLAIECKNVKPNFPLLVTAVRRSVGESYHDVALVADREEQRHGPFNISMLGPPRARARSHRLHGRQTMYAEGKPVGKSTTQVGINLGREGELVAGDSEVYEKWSQCLSSLKDLVGEIEGMRDAADERGQVLAIALPVLVVPDGTLWQTVYGDDGARIDDPCQVSRVSIYVGKDYSLGLLNGDDFVVSHFEVMTASGLEDFARQSLTSREAMSQVFFGGADPARVPAG